MTGQAQETEPWWAGLASRAGACLVVYLVVLAVVLFSPTSEAQAAAVVDVGRLLQPVLPDSWLGFARLEVLLNAAIIAPVTFLASLTWPRVRWQDWTTYGLIGATSVELLQLLLLPGRQASFSDIVANTLGAFLGAVLAHLLRRRRRAGGA